MNSFYTNVATDINMARTDFLKKLNLDLCDKSVLETGCGGKGDITKCLLEYTNKITLNDSRKENILNLQENIGTNLEYNTCDLNTDCDGEFDVIISFGTLYHLDNPANAIKIMSESTRELMVISTCSNGKDDGIRYVAEQGQNQSSTGTGCRPGRSWVANELKKYFSYVYFTTGQPEFKDFNKDWTSQAATNNARFFIIGSNVNLDSNPKLTKNPPLIYE